MIIGHLHNPLAAMDIVSKLRIGVGAVLLCLALYVGWTQAMAGNVATAIGAIAFIVAVVPVVAFSKELAATWPIQIAAAVMTVTGLVAIFTEQRAFDTDLVRARLDAGLAMLAADGRCPGQAELLRNAAAACLVQDHIDQLTAAGEGGKAIYLPPTLGLLDQAHTTAAGEPRDACAEGYRNVRRACPLALAQLPRSSRRTLDDTAP